MTPAYIGPAFFAPLLPTERLLGDVRDAVAEELTAHLRQQFPHASMHLPDVVRMEMGKYMTERYPRLSGSFTLHVRPGGLVVVAGPQ